MMGKAGNSAGVVWPLQNVWDFSSFPFKTTLLSPLLQPHIPPPWHPGLGALSWQFWPGRKVGEGEKTRQLFPIEPFPMEKLLCVLGLLSAEPQAEMTAFRLLGKVMEKQTSVSRWLCWSFGSTSTGQLRVKKTLFRFSQMGKIPCLKPTVGRKRCGGGGVGARGQNPRGRTHFIPWEWFIEARCAPLNFPRKFLAAQHPYPRGST